MHAPTDRPTMADRAVNAAYTLGRVTLPGTDATARQTLQNLQTADARHRAGRIFLILRGVLVPHPEPKDPARHAKAVARRRAANRVAKASRKANR